MDTKPREYAKLALTNISAVIVGYIVIYLMLIQVNASIKSMETKAF